MKQWTRVTGDNLQPYHAAAGLKVDGLLRSEKFKKACEEAGIPVTRRQAMKLD